jgi:hypothetical protein
VSAYIFTHDHFGVNGSKGLAHNTDLLGSDVVDIHEDALGVVVARVLDVFPDFVFGVLGVPFHGHIYYEFDYYYSYLRFCVKNNRRFDAAAIRP